MRFIQQYRIYQSTYAAPDFAEPPNYLRQYETQVCATLSNLPCFINWKEGNVLF